MIKIYNQFCTTISDEPNPVALNGVSATPDRRDSLHSYYCNSISGAVGRARRALVRTIYLFGSPEYDTVRREPDRFERFRSDSDVHASNVVPESRTIMYYTLRSWVTQRNRGPTTGGAVPCNVVTHHTDSRKYIKTSRGTERLRVESNDDRVGHERL